MIRLHNSHKPIERFEHRPFLKTERDVFPFKPRGLWYGIDEAWLKWCRSEEPEWIGPYNYAVLLTPKANILKLGTVKAVRDFTAAYQREAWEGSTLRSIDWHKAMTEYDGLEIHPYQWSLRLNQETFWYYGWDCASGCVWHPRAVRALKPVEIPEKEVA
jgi:hypothetical protein